VERSISNPPGALVELSAAELANKQATLQTSQGEIVIELFGQEAPIAVSNFITLSNKKFYDGLKFHRYVANFVIQGGDPQGTGYGGPGYTFIDEPVTKDYTAGIVAMANSGPNTNGSQFFIVLENQPSLPKSYTIFGRVTSGLDNVKKLRAGDTITSVTIGDLTTSQ
jgi:cyclophilin family peptidyl-prolyl cis-trans isomerase